VIVPATVQVIVQVIEERTHGQAEQTVVPTIVAVADRMRPTRLVIVVRATARRVRKPGRQIVRVPRLVTGLPEAGVTMRLAM
jgi:hypothetical protein